MTSKPETVSQEAWDDAAIHMEAADWQTWLDGTERLFARASIALAIMAAKAEEREACAKTADEIGAGRSRQCSEARSAKKRTEARDFESMAMSAIDVGYAIRKRGEA